MMINKSETTSSFWKRLAKRFCKSIGYIQLKDESTIPTVIVEMSPICPKTESCVGSERTLITEDQRLNKDISNEILKTSGNLPWHKKHQGLVFMVIATMMGSVLNLSIKAVTLSDEKLPILELVFIRGIIGSLISLALMYHQKVQHWMGDPEAIKLLFLRGFLAFLALSFNFFALFTLSVGDATIISFFAPVFTGFLGSVILKEKWERIDQLAGFFSLIGVIFIARPPFLFGKLADNNNDSMLLPDEVSIPAIIVDSENADVISSNSALLPDTSLTEIFKRTSLLETSNASLEEDLLRLLGVIMGLSAAICAASSFIVVRKLKGLADPLHIIFYYHWLLVPLSLVLAPFMNMDSSPWIIPQHIYTWIIVILGTIFGILGQLFFTKALQTEAAGKAAAINYIQVTFVFFGEWLLWGTVPRSLSLFGAGIIILSFVFATIYKTNSR